MARVEIERRVLEFHRVHPVSGATAGQISKFLKSLPPEERLYAATYGVSLAGGEPRVGLTLCPDVGKRESTGEVL